LERCSVNLERIHRVDVYSPGRTLLGGLGLGESNLRDGDEESEELEKSEHDIGMGWAFVKWVNKERRG
jgi:hypothetical protein